MGRHHEVAIQRGAPLREEAGRGGEDPEEVSRQSPRHCGEKPQGQDWGPGQEEVPSSLRSHSRPVLFPHPEEDQPQAGGCSLLLRQQRDSPTPLPPWAPCTRNTMKKISSSTLPTQTSLFMEIKSNSSSSNLHKYLDS